MLRCMLFRCLLKQQLLQSTCCGSTGSTASRVLLTSANDDLGKVEHRIERARAILFWFCTFLEQRVVLSILLIHAGTLSPHATGKLLELYVSRRVA